MSEPISSTRSEEKKEFLPYAQETPSLEAIARAIEEEVTGSAVAAEPQAKIDDAGSLVMDIQLTTTNREWLEEFRVASPQVRALMLSMAMDLFNDGQEGIFISFSEPVIK